MAQCRTSLHCQARCFIQSLRVVWRYKRFTLFAVNSASCDFTSHGQKFVSDFAKLAIGGLAQVMIATIFYSNGLLMKVITPKGAAEALERYAPWFVKLKPIVGSKLMNSNQFRE
ncbi:hypothetical protein DLR71_16245 [Vibrio paracholerae]|nr:hypothetical protein DLR71_16245 [Vibrio paracholerae]